MVTSKKGKTVTCNDEEWYLILLLIRPWVFGTSILWETLWRIRICEVVFWLHAFFERLKKYIDTDCLWISHVREKHWTGAVHQHCITMETQYFMINWHETSQKSPPFFFEVETRHNFYLSIYFIILPLPVSICVPTMCCFFDHQSTDVVTTLPAYACLFPHRFRFALKKKKKKIFFVRATIHKTNLYWQMKAEKEAGNMVKVSLQHWSPKEHAKRWVFFCIKPRISNRPCIGGKYRPCNITGINRHWNP